MGTPLHGALGHFRTNVRILSTTAQAANAPIWSLRNPGPNLLVLTKLRMEAFQEGAGTAQQNAIDAYRVTGFTTNFTTNASTPAGSVKRPVAGGMAAYPGTAQPRFHNGGSVNGMTGATLVKDGSRFCALSYPVAAAATTNAGRWVVDALNEEADQEHPFVLHTNEGLIIENRTLNVTSYGIAWNIDFAWAEVNAYTHHQGY